MATTAQDRANLTFIASFMLNRRSRHMARVAHFLQGPATGMVLASGPMQSDKTETLLAIIGALRDLTVLRVKPKGDNRNPGFHTHTAGTRTDAYEIETVDELHELVRTHDPAVIAVDETQFLGNEFADAFIDLAQTRIVLVSMLDTTFYALPWSMYTQILTRSTQLPKSRFLHLQLMGVCQNCGSQQATRSQLMVPAPKEGTVLTGGREIYRTVCAKCHRPPPESQGS